MTRRSEPFATEAGAAIPPAEGSAHLPEGPASRRWRALDRLVLVAVAISLLVPAALLAAGVKARAIENRPLFVMPAVSVDGLLDGSWAKGVDAFLADNVAVRPIAVRLRGYAFYRSGGTGTTDVLRGKGNWLFPTNAFDPTCTHSIDEVTAAIGRAAAALDRAGIAVRFVVVPDKQTIYPEQVASNPVPPSCTDLGRPALRAAIAGLGVRGIDSWTLLDAAKLANPNVLLWYPGDTHWTSAGAIPIAGALVSSLEPAIWDASEIVTAERSSHADDLARSIGISRIERLPKVTGRIGVDVVQVNVPVSVQLHSAPSIFTTTVQSVRPTVPGRTLIIYDSAFNEQQALLAPWFASATWVNGGDLQSHPELATQLGPFNTVIVDRVERFLYASDLDALLQGFER